MSRVGRTGSSYVCIIVRNGEALFWLSWGRQILAERKLAAWAICWPPLGPWHCQGSCFHNGAYSLPTSHPSSSCPVRQMLPNPGRSQLEPNSPMGSPLICLFDSSQPLPTFSVMRPLSSWGCFSSPPIKMTGTGWDPSSLDSEAGSPWQCKQETFLPGPPTENFPINLLDLDCLTKLLAGTSLRTVTTQEPLAPNLVGTWIHTNTETHIYMHTHTFTHLHTHISLGTASRYGWVR